MRILVLQLARFGDIYQTWPTLQAMKRKHPGCELHVMVRQRFQEAAQDFPGVTVHALPTQEIMRPLFEGLPLEDSHAELKAFLAPLCDADFDSIVNLSFSPASSYLTDYLASSRTEVRGYTRHSDGHFNIPDDTSAYFYAQVGIGRANRYHLTEIFASVAGVDLTEDDFRVAELTYAGPRHGVVVHLGASSAEKIYPPELWVHAIREILESSPMGVTLVGSAAERGLAETVTSQLCHAEELTNRVGETSLRELFQTVSGASLLIGADSAPIHIAGLTRTRVLNLSSSAVNFWETGPLSSGSRILYHENIQKISPRDIAQEALALLNHAPPGRACAVRDSLLSPYRLHDLHFDDFSWQLVQALYTGSAYPTAAEVADQLAFQRLFELSELALKQLERWPRLQDRAVAGQILQQVDTLLTEVGKLTSGVNPVVQWFETQRLRIPPGADDETLKRTVSAFQDLYWVSSVYRQFGDVAQVTAKALALCKECAPEIREYNMNGVSASFQNLVSTFHELARHSTKVAPAGWSSVLDEMNSALEKRDYIQLADFLEWRMIPALNSQLNETETSL